MTTAKHSALDLLADVADPELPVLSVVDLGMVRDVEESPDGRRVRVTLTPTYSGCPAFDVIVGDVRTALAAAYDDVQVDTRLSPAWTTDWLSSAARDKLAAANIAPPGRTSLPLVAEPAPAACPHCGAADVERLAEFGATACTALWRCRACREPFDHMKPH